MFRLKIYVYMRGVVFMVNQGFEPLFSNTHPIPQLLMDIRYFQPFLLCSLTVVKQKPVPQRNKRRSRLS